jgi:HEAT repeat protein
LESGFWFDEMDADPCGAIRVWSLRSRVARDEIAAIPALRSALFDAAASVRASARFHLSRLEPELVVANLYRDALDRSGDGSALAIAIAGLSEVGTRDDAALISFCTSSASVPVAKAAIRACARLARQDCTREFIEALNDSRVGVSKAARIALACTPLSAALLIDLVRDAVHTHTRLNTLVLSEKLGCWDWLIALLDASQNDRVEVRNAARLATERWLSVVARSAYLPAPPARAQLEQIRPALAAIPDPASRLRVQQAVEG